MIYIKKVSNGYVVDIDVLAEHEYDSEIKQYVFNDVKDVEALVKDTLKKTAVLRTTIEQVKEFHCSFGSVIPKEITIDNQGVNELRISLLREELDELITALNDKDQVEVLDALTDLQYVLDGAYLDFGLSSYKDAAFNEVHNSNMSKLGEDGKPVKREDGKIMKGPNYKEPDLKRILYGQM